MFAAVCVLESGCLESCCCLIIICASEATDIHQKTTSSPARLRFFLGSPYIGVKGLGGSSNCGQRVQLRSHSFHTHTHAHSKSRLSRNDKLGGALDSFRDLPFSWDLGSDLLCRREQGETTCQVSDDECSPYDLSPLLSSTSLSKQNRMTCLLLP